MYPTKPRKHIKKYQGTNSKDILRELHREAIAGGLDLSYEDVYNIVNSIPFFFEREMREGNTFSMAYLGYFDPKPKNKIIVEARKKREKKQAEKNKKRIFRRQNAYMYLWLYKKTSKERFEKKNQDLISKGEPPITWQDYCKQIGYSKQVNKLKTKYDSLVRIYNVKKKP